MSTTLESSTQAPALPAVTRTGIGKLALTHPPRRYAVTGNPFAVPAVLPLIVATFLGLDAALLLNVDPYVMCGAFLTLTCGWMLIPAVVLRGSVHLSHDGIVFERGKDLVTADWTQATGLEYKSDCGVCLTLVGAVQSRPDIKLPGGFRAKGGAVQIPLRMFGDRQYSILYDILDQVPEAQVQNALKMATRWTTRKSQAIYAGMVAFSAAALIVVMWIYTH